MKTIRTSTMKNWSFKRKKGKIEGNVRLCLLSGTNQRKQRLWSPKITPNGQSSLRPKSRECPPQGIHVALRSQGGSSDQPTAQTKVCQLGITSEHPTALSKLLKEIDFYEAKCNSY